MTLKIADLEKFLVTPTPDGAMPNLRTFYSPIDDDEPAALL